MEEVLRYLNNYFFRFKEVGNFTIENNKIIGLKGKYIKGQYLLIEGSTLNDGVVKVETVIGNEITLEKPFNEEFKGVIYSLAIPQAVISLVDEINLWKADNNKTDIISESFEGYSYSRANSNGQVATWKDVFREELKGYRKVTDGKRLVREVKA